ncbi:MAG: hypothetical protein FWE62_05915, partial [Firmicutes bacterium]|nr:hypothetical protein [Bacillota bacterium]
FAAETVNANITLYAGWETVGYRPEALPAWYVPLVEGNKGGAFPSAANTGIRVGTEYVTNAAEFVGRNVTRPAGNTVRSKEELKADPATWLHGPQWTQGAYGVNELPLPAGEVFDPNYVYVRLPDYNHPDLDPIVPNVVYKAARHPNRPFHADIDGAVYENMYFPGGVFVSARDVTFINCYIDANFGYEAGNAVWGGSGGSYNAAYRNAFEVAYGASGDIIWSEVNGNSGVHSAISHSGSRNMSLGNYLYGANDGIYARGRAVSNSDPVRDQAGCNFVHMDNYITDFTPNTANGHIDGWQSEGVITNGLNHHNYYECPTFASGAYANFATNSRFVMASNNLFAGAGYVIRSYSQTAGLFHTNMWFVDNVFEDFNGQRPNVGGWAIWFTSRPSDAVFFWPTAAELGISPYNFNPWTTPSFHSGNIVRSTGENVDGRNVGDPIQIPVDPGDWAHSGNGNALIEFGRHNLDKSFNGLVTLELKIRPLINNTDAAVGYTRTGVVINPSGTGGSHDSWSNYNILFALRTSGLFGMYNGTGVTNIGAWVESNKPYEAGKWYEVRIITDTAAMLFTGWVREIDADGNPFEDWFCVGEDFTYRNVSNGTNGIVDIAAVWTGPGNSNSYALRGHTVSEGYPDADYTAVETAIEAAYVLNRDLYLDFSGVDAAIDAVIYDLDFRSQTIIDGYADAIIAAIEALVPKPTDVTVVSADSAKFIGIRESSKRIWVVSFTVNLTYSDGTSGTELFTFSLNGNNANLDGKYVFDEGMLNGYTLVYDIKGNGSNIKEFKLILN